MRTCRRWEKRTDYIVTLPKLIEPLRFWCGRRFHCCCHCYRKIFSSCVCSPSIDKYFVTKPPPKSNPHETKPNQIKISFWKKMFWFGMKSKDKWVFFSLTHSSLFEIQNDTHLSLITDTNPLTNIYLCVSLLQPLLSAFPTKQRFPTVFTRVLKYLK